MAEDMNNCAEDNMFKEASDRSDEVILIFDDGRKLYASESFLCCASPVFEAMFKYDFKEKETREILLKEKSFEIMHELLLCLHPAVQKPIDNENVLLVVALADEYQAKHIIKRCKDTMKKWVLSDLTDATRQTEQLFCRNDKCRYISASTCFQILKVADACNYEEIVDYVIKILGKYGYNIFTGSGERPSPSQEVKSFNPCHEVGNSGDSRRDCSTLYESLTEHMKNRLMLARLRACDNGSLRK